MCRCGQMRYKNIDIHNICEIINLENGAISWCRVPYKVYENMESELGKKQCMGSTGVELRFVMKSDTVTLRMRSKNGNGIFHIYRGSIQGGWKDHEVDKIVCGEFSEYVINKSENVEIINIFITEFLPEFDTGFKHFSDP